MNGLEDLEGLNRADEGIQDIEGLSDVAKSYLQEMDISNENWDTYPGGMQNLFLVWLDTRLEELNVDPAKRPEIVNELFSSEMAEAYSEYNAQKLSEVLEFTEAPQDYIQIEQISELLAECSDLKYENWEQLEISEKEAVLNGLEIKIAEIEHRPACPIRLIPMDLDTWGGFNPGTKTIDINAVLADIPDYDIYREIIDTLVHEGRHAYQDYNVNVCQVHPRASEVASWAEVMEGGKWPYWNDCSTVLGLRLYEQQSIEIDARNFAADVLAQMDLKA